MHAMLALGKPRPLPPIPGTFTASGCYQVESNMNGILGQGSFSRVFRGSFLSDPTRSLACKMILLDNDNRKYYTHECDAITRLQMLGVASPYLVQFYSFGEKWLNSINYGLLVMQLLPRETLADRLKTLHREDTYLPCDTVFHFARQLVHAVGVLHRAGIAHCDIKTENVAVDWPARTLTLYDLGFARTVPLADLHKLHTSITPVVQYASPLFMAPEQDPNHKGNITHNPFHSDIWQLGHVFYCLMTNRPLFHKCEELHELTPLLHRTRPRAALAHRIVIENSRYQTLLDATLVYRPAAARASIEALDAFLAPSPPPPPVDNEDEDTMDL